MISPAIYRAAKVQADVYRIPLHHLLAFIEVETNGDAFDPVAGQDRALIRWEGHYFRDRLKGHPEALDEALRVGLAGAPQEVANPREQEKRYRLLELAADLCRNHGLDPDLAYECVSIGLGQVMGAHWRSLGYPSARQMLEEAHNETPDKDVADQLEMVMRFLVENNAMDDLRHGRWTPLARTYNGRNYARNRYDTKLAAAARRYEAKPLPGTQHPTLKLGRGPGYAVEELQRRLHALGYPVGASDGVFGRATRNAVLAFQADNDLEPDGTVGPNTWAKLTAAETAAAPASVERRQATIEDVRRKGSSTVKKADTGEIVSGGAVVGGVVAEMGGGGAIEDALGKVEQAQGWLWRVRSAVDTFGDVLTANWPIVLVLFGVGAFYLFHRIKQTRLEDHRSGRHMGR